MMSDLSDEGDEDILGGGFMLNESMEELESKDQSASHGDDNEEDISNVSAEHEQDESAEYEDEYDSTQPEEKMEPDAKEAEEAVSDSDEENEVHDESFNVNEEGDEKDVSSRGNRTHDESMSAHEEGDGEDSVLTPSSPVLNGSEDDLVDGQKLQDDEDAEEKGEGQGIEDNEGSSEDDHDEESVNHAEGIKDLDEVERAEGDKDRRGDEEEEERSDKGSEKEEDRESEDERSVGSRESSPERPSSDKDGERSHEEDDDDDEEMTVRRKRVKRKQVGSSDEGSESDDEKSDADEDDSPRKRKKRRRVASGSNSESEDEEGGEKDKLVNDIFGDSDEETENKEATKEEEEKEKEKEKEEEEEKEKTEGGEAEGGSEEKKEILPELTDSSSDEGPNDREQMGDFASDFDMMMQRKKLERGYRRRRKNVDIISDSDDLIADLMVDMRNAAEEDRELNLKGEPAIKKLSVMKRAQNELLKADLQHAFLDSGILNVFTEWLSPMPDRSLPSLKIRTAFLKILQQFPRVESHALKASGIGKAIMYLYKHPKETKENRMRAGKLINEWSRPIFNLATNFSAMSKEEREQRDFEQLNKAKRISNDGGSTPARRESTSESEDTPRRPGDPGWVYRARVPQPSTKAYVVRPKWKSDIDISKSTKKGMSHLEKQLQELKRNRKKQQRAVKISIEGNRMAL